MLEMIITDNIYSRFAISIKGTVPRNFYHFFVKLVSPISRIIGTTPSIIYKHRSPIFEEQYQSKSQSYKSAYCRVESNFLKVNFVGNIDIKKYIQCKGEIS